MKYLNLLYLLLNSNVLIAIGTLLLVVVAYCQLKDLNNTNKETFLHNLKNDFFTDYERRLIFLIENKYLTFKEITGLPVFFESNIPSETKSKIEDELLLERKYYRIQEIDDYLLQHFEDLGILLDKGRLNLNDINEGFGYYLKLCWNSDPIKKYIFWVRKNGDSEAYSKFEILCKEIKFCGGTPPNLLTKCLLKLKNDKSIRNSF